jgi:hypothetical protein
LPSRRRPCWQPGPPPQGPQRCPHPPGHWKHPSDRGAGTASPQGRAHQARPPRSRRGPTGCHCALRCRRRSGRTQSQSRRSCPRQGSASPQCRPRTGGDQGLQRPPWPRPPCDSTFGQVSRAHWSCAACGPYQQRNTSTRHLMRRGSGRETNTQTVVCSVARHILAEAATEQGHGQALVWGLADGLLQLSGAARVGGGCTQTVRVGVTVLVSRGGCLWRQHSGWHVQ